MLTLDLRDPWLAFLDQFEVLSLLYSYRVNGCALRYRLSSPTRAEIVSIDGSKAADWPYPAYPQSFPVVPIALEAPRIFAKEDFADDGKGPAVTWQASKPGEYEFLVVLPPNAAYGVSLWGPEGDAEEVQTVFEFNMKKQIVRAWNECT